MFSSRVKFVALLRGDLPVLKSSNRDDDAVLGLDLEDRASASKKRDKRLPAGAFGIRFACTARRVGLCALAQPGTPRDGDRAKKLR